MSANKQTSEFDWDDARFFLAAARAGSLLGAAKALGVSHSTVKRRIEGLERSLGVRLFTPTGEGLQPTDAAREAMDVAEQVEQSIGRFGDRLAGASRELSGSLIVTAVDAMVDLLAPVFKQYAKQFPKVALTLYTDNRPLDLGRREADIAVRITNKPDENLFGRKVGDCDYRPFASRELLESCGQRLADLPWVMWDHSAGATGTEAWFRRKVKGRSPAIRVTNTTAMIMLARESVGAAILPEPCGVAAGLTPIGEPIEGFRTGIWCLCHQDLRHSDRVRRFMEEAAQSLAI